MPLPKKKQPAVIAAEPPPTQGYRRPYRYREFEYKEMPGLEPGMTALKVTVPINFSFGELDDLREHTKAGESYESVFQYIAQYIKEWNLTRVALETGQSEPVPPPAEAGWEVLQLLDHIEAHWVIDKLRFGHLALIEDASKVMDLMRKAQEAERKNASAPSESTPETSNDVDSESEG